MSKLRWSTTHVGDDWRLPTINEVRNYFIDLVILNDENCITKKYEHVLVQEKSLGGKSLFVSTHDFVVSSSGVYSPSRIVCSGENESVVPSRESLLKLYSTRHKRGHSTLAFLYGATVNDCIAVFIDGKSIFTLAALGRDVAIQTMCKFDHIFLDRLSVILSHDFHGTNDDAMELLEDAQIARNIGFDIYEASIAKRYGMTHDEAAEVVKWGIDQSNYTQMLVTRSGIHADVKNIMECENSAYNIQLFFIVLNEETLHKRKLEKQKYRFSKPYLCYN